jgi:hypothetical protein
VVPHAFKPPTRVPTPVPAEATIFTTMDVGTPGVSVLLIKSLRAERETNPSGVIGQAQQEINCSSGENVNTFAQMLPF